jgi:hypothetical protein
MERRDFLKLAGTAALGAGFLGRFALPGWAAPLVSPAAATAAAKPARAKALIQVWLWGGPPHLDTFDPKPDAGYDYCGPFNHPLQTNVPGIQINELLPILGQEADKYSIIRSMTHGDNGHETAAYVMQTGHKPGGDVVYPSVGSVVSLFRGYDHGYTGLIPPFVVMTQGLGRFAPEGCLGLRYAPFVTGGDPNAKRFAVEGVVAENITDDRQRDRRDLLHSSTPWIRTCRRMLPSRLWTRARPRPTTSSWVTRARSSTSRWKKMTCATAMAATPSANPA